MNRFDIKKNEIYEDSTKKKNEKIHFYNPLKIKINWEEILHCPLCNKKLTMRNNNIICQLCGFSVEIKHQLISLDEFSDFYWGEIPEDVMMEVIDLSRQDGWHIALDRIVAPSYPKLMDMIVAEDRVDWLTFFDENPMTILDIGGGWGQTGYLLAKNRKHTVISLEKIYKRAEFQSIRAVQQGLANLCIIHGDIFNTKFKPETFDLVSFIGVLEWIGTTTQFLNPRQAQLEALKLVYSSLKYGGSVVIGIENRLGFNNFLGALDHSGLRFTSLMPRKMANLYMRLRNPTYRSNKSYSAYRTYTYSNSGYIKLLKEAGFEKVQIFVTHPHYAHPRCLIEFRNRDVRYFFSHQYRPTSFKDFLFTSIFRILSIFGVAPNFAPHFLIVGCK